jgi:TonB family protein
MTFGYLEMSIIFSNRKKCIGFIYLFFFLQGVRAQQASFAFVDSKAIVTLEFSGLHQATLNLFNMNKYLVVLKAQNLWVTDESGAVSIGQVFKRENADPEESLYLGSYMVEPWTYKAVDILGAYPAPRTIRQAILVLGGKRLVLKPAAPGEMEELAARIQEVDLTLKNGAQILQRANIAPRGSLSYPTGEEDELDLAIKRMMGTEDINPPRILSRTSPQLTEEARKAGLSQAQIKLSVSLDKNGEIRDVKVVKGLGYGLDERAMASVRNSWKFLPATQYSEPADTVATIVVSFAGTSP